MSRGIVLSSTTPSLPPSATLSMTVPQLGWLSMAVATGFFAMNNNSFQGCYVNPLCIQLLPLRQWLNGRLNYGLDWKEVPSQYM